MTVRDIVRYPEQQAVLREVSRPVRIVNQRVQRLVRDLQHTLSADSNGAGLAAPQIGVHSRVVVVRLGGRRDDADDQREPGPPLALINPTITETGNEERDFDGCLSFPGLFGETIRPHHLRVTGLSEAGDPFDRVFERFDAVVVHHEIDHLDGVLFIDRIESAEDLYRVRRGEDGELTRVPVVTVASLPFS